jgi:hypothetical protein
MKITEVAKHVRTIELLLVLANPRRATVNHKPFISDLSQANILT